MRKRKLWSRQWRRFFFRFFRRRPAKEAAYAEYHRAQEQMRELLIHKANAAYLPGLDEQNRQTTERQREEK